MRVLLSTIGSRGDVQPLVALGHELRALGHEVRLCVPPDFRDWIEGLGMPVTPIGPEVRASAKAPRPSAPATAEQIREAINGTVATQFATIADAAQDCDVIVGATALQVAAPSIAERLGIPYVFVAYSPTVLPSRHHPPPVLTSAGEAPAGPMADYSHLWVQDARRWNEMWAAPLNAQRVSLGLAPVSDVRGYVLTDRPWLAADPILAPWPDPDDGSVLQTGAWVLPDARPLSAELDAFLEAGEPPIYFGFGSARAPDGIGPAAMAAARALGRRALLSSGWADLSPPDDRSDCLVIGDVNYQALFPRVAAVVHHGGAGTATAAAHAGVPQVVIPQVYDQHYMAQRIQRLGIGAAHPPATPTAESLATLLAETLSSGVAARARTIASAMRRDGARIAAARLIAMMAPQRNR